MHKVLERYFSLVDTVYEQIKSKKGHGLRSFDCPACHTEEGWEQKLATIFEQHGIDLGQFAVHRRFPGDNVIFSYHDGELTCQCPGGWSMDDLLRHTAQYLPTD